MGSLVNINGALMPPDRAFVSVFDRGFLYGDSVYEVCRTYRRTELFELGAHLARLQASADKIGMQLPLSLEALGRQMAYTTEMAELPGDAYVRLICTRGSGEISLDPAAAVNPTFVVIVKPLESPPAELYTKGAHIELVSVRRNPRQSLDPAAKTGNYLNSILAVAEGRKKQANESVMLDLDGTVTEGATSNVFLVRGGTLITPALDVGILAGVTRKLVLELARELKIPVEERRVKPEELQKADEAFLASSIREILPISSVGEFKIPIGAVTARLRAAFKKRTEVTRG